MSYVDGYVLAVPTANKEAYKKLALSAAAVFKEYGALNVVETWGDDAAKVLAGDDLELRVALPTRFDAPVEIPTGGINASGHRDGIASQFAS